MELTLTGAPLVPKTNRKRVGIDASSSSKGGMTSDASPLFSNSTASTKPTPPKPKGNLILTPNGVGPAADHSHNHQHHQHQAQTKSCCANHGPKRTPIQMMPMTVPEKTEDKIKMMLQAIKFGPYEMFELMGEALEDKEDLEGPIDWIVQGNPSVGAHSLAHWAAKRAPDLRFMNYLQKRSINLHIQSTDSVGMFPIHWACFMGHIPMVSIILQNNPIGSTSPTSTLLPMASTDKAGCTPLLIAAQCGHADLCAYLCKQVGCDVFHVDNSLDTALHWAAYKGAVEVAGLLLYLEQNDEGGGGGGTGSGIGLMDKFGQTPLHLASLRGNTDVVEYLLEEAEYHSHNNPDQAPLNPLPSLATILEDLENPSPAASVTSPTPLYLLHLPDKDGKTPLDLAVKKKRIGCIQVLRSWEERYAPPSSSSCVTFTTCWHKNVVQPLRAMTSLTNWKLWMGLSSEFDDAQYASRNLRFPFMLVLTFTSIAFPVYFKSLVWIAEISTWLRIFTVSMMAINLVAFYWTWSTNPGCIMSSRDLCEKTRSGVGENKCYSFLGMLCARFHGMRRFLLCVSNNRRGCGAWSLRHCGSGGTPNSVERSLREITNDLRAQYDAELDSYVGGKSTSQSKKQLCHTCRIVRPPRSKHCRIQRRCVLVFDHYCPFVGNTVGMYNYRYFYWYVTSLILGMVSYLITVAQYLWRTEVRNALEEKPGRGVICVGIVILLMFVPLGGLWVYHTQLIKRNLTTNEHSNMGRYDYLFEMRKEEVRMDDKGNVIPEKKKCCENDSCEDDKAPQDLNVRTETIQRRVYNNRHDLGWKRNFINRVLLFPSPSLFWLPDTSSTVAKPEKKPNKMEEHVSLLTY